MRERDGCERSCSSGARPPTKLAEAVQVDAKTVERWITKGRIPYRRHRFEVAAFFGVDESYIWPDALGRDEVAAVSESEIVAVYPHRWAVPRDSWDTSSARPSGDRRAGLLRACSSPRTRACRRFHRTGQGRACGSGSCSVTRTASDVTERGETEGIGDAHGRQGPQRPGAVPAAAGEPGWRSGCTARCCTTRSTVPMTSCWSTPTSTASWRNNAPVFHLRKIPGGEMASTYMDSFERVWDGATPYEGR